MTSSAYTTVTTRRAFGSDMPTQTQPPKTSTVFSDDVRAYVQKCFAAENAVVGVSVAEMQGRLKIIINDAASAGALDTTNWRNMALPQHLIVQERQAKARQGLSDSTNKINPKKRKSLEMDDTREEQLPPWRRPSSNVFEDRVSYPAASQTPRTDKKQRKAKEGFTLNETDTDLARRRERFGLDASTQPVRKIAEVSTGPVVGTSETLEKRYFRLTSAPKAENVRPQRVLEKTLELLKAKWKSEYNYAYICDQFKSMRQDLTVQHIKNAFTVNVYETHAHIALQKGDLGEYNQCQSQLRALYKQRLGGRPAEFLAYRILYYIYTGNRTDMSHLLASITSADREAAPVRHALDVRSALALGNYHRFFKLYLDAPNMAPYLMDMFIARERLNAMACICKSYKPEVPLSFLAEELAFENERELAGFVCDHGGETLLESKPTGPVFLSGKAGQLFETAKTAAFRRVDLKGQI